MKQNKFVAGACALLIAALLCACGTGTMQTAQEKTRVALIAKSTNTEFWRSVFAGAQAAATEYNISLTINGPETEEDYETQNAMVAEAVKDGAQVLVFSAIDFENNTSAIDAAAAAGVKIVTIDSGVSSSFVSTYIGTDNYAAGQQAAQAALQCGYDRINVGLVNYDVNSANGQERERGVRDVLSGLESVEVVEVINVLSVAGNAQTGTSAMLRAHPEINVIIAFNEPVSVGAARAISNLRMENETFLVGFDSNVETVDKLQTGAVDALIVQNPYAMGYLGVESAHKLQNGRENTLEPTVDTSTMVVTVENMFTVDAQKALFSFE